jgi:hypothetical protein
LLDLLRDPFEASDEIGAKYYVGAVDGAMPYYENETIKKGKAASLHHVS